MTDLKEKRYYICSLGYNKIASL